MFNRLYLKQKKLLKAAISDNFYLAYNSGFYFTPEDINTVDEKGNCALYYVTKF